MKKVVDWTFGSIFRTFGRIIAYLIFGIAISYILHSLDFRITDLFLDNVKATNFSSSYTDAYYKDASRTNIMTTHGAPTADYYGIEYYYNDGIDRYIVNYYNNFFFKTNVTTTSQTNVMYIPIYFYTGQSTINDNVFSLSAYIHDTRDNKYYACERISYASQDEVYSQLKCPFRKGAVIDKIETYVSYRSGSNIQALSYYLNRFYTLEYEDDVQAIIDNQNQNNQNIINNQNNQTQQIIQQQQNATEQMLDSNTTQAESDAEGFFGDFDVPDVGGLSAIITAPLNTIRSLLSSSCSQLVLPLPYVDEDLTLPCMNSIYTQHFGLFFSLYQTIILAIISYRCIRSIYFDITGFTNPDDDRIEVMDL